MNILLNILSIIDGWLIDNIFQPAAKWFQVKTGRTCFFLADTFTSVFLVCSLLRDHVTHDILGLFLDIFIVLMTLFMIDVAQESTRSLHSQVWSANPARTSWFWAYPRKVLFFTLLFSPIRIMFIIHPNYERFLALLVNLSLNLAYFFMACEPLPPRPNKIFQWILMKLGSLASK